MLWGITVFHIVNKNKVEKSSNESSDRDFSMDTLRTISILLVVLLHASSPYVNRNLESINHDFWVGNIIESFTRISVPIFVLISGRFLLSKNTSPSEFYKKRFNRIFIPILFWSSVYLMYVYAGSVLAGYEFDPVKRLLYGIPFYHMFKLRVCST